MIPVFLDRIPGDFIIVSKEFEILSVSKRLLEQLGFDGRELLGKPVGLLLPYKSISTDLKGGIAEYLVVSGKAEVVETKVFRRDGLSFPIILECTAWDDRYILYVKETFGIEIDNLTNSLFERAFLGDSREMLGDFVVKMLSRMYLVAGAAIENFFGHKLGSAGEKESGYSQFQFALVDGYKLKVYVRKNYLTEERLFKFKKLADRLILAFQLVDQFYKMRLQTVAVENINTAILITSPQGMLEWANAAFYIRSGYDESEVVGKSLAVMDSGVQSSSFYNEMKTQVLTGKTWRGEVVERRKDDQLYAVMQTVSPLENAEGRIMHFLVIQEDLTALRKIEGKLVDYQNYDMLTGLPNRKHFEHLLTNALKADEKARWAVIAFDMVGMNKINDSLGHLAGDMALKETGRRLLNAIGKEDLVCRMISDEFLVACRILQKEELLEAVEKYMNILTQPYMIKNEVIHLGTHAGIALSPEDGENVDQLINAANIALHNSKAQGNLKTRFFTFYSPKLLGEITEDFLLVRDLRKALEKDDELFLVYQPQHSLAENGTFSAEGLVRWRHPDRGIISPGIFIPLAEENDLIVKLGRKVMDILAKDMKAFKAAALDMRYFAVNASAEEFMEGDFLEFVAAKKDALGYPLELELTESTLMRDPKRMAETLSRLSDSGVKIAIDDFGSGYSSLNYLSHLTVNTLKIDQTFLSALDKGMNREIVKSIVQLGHALNLTVLAEGVETEQQRDFLKEVGCDLIQGYFFSKPLVREDFIAFVAGKRERHVA